MIDSLLVVPMLALDVVSLLDVVGSTLPFVLIAAPFAAVGIEIRRSR